MKNKLSGEFIEKEFGHAFFFRAAEPNQFGATHEIETADGFRYANIKKTVAYVVVDEAADGSAVFSRWSISNYKEHT